MTRSVFQGLRRDADRVSVFWWRWVVVAAYMLALFTASSGPGLVLPPERNWDKALHAGAFGVLALLCAWALTRGPLRAATWPVLLAACLIAILYGAADEFHQSFVPGRDADVFDLFADALGAFAAAGAIRAWGIIARGSN